MNEASGPDLSAFEFENDRLSAAELHEFMREEVWPKAGYLLLDNTKKREDLETLATAEIMHRGNVYGVQAEVDVSQVEQWTSSSITRALCWVSVFARRLELNPTVIARLKQMHRSEVFFKDGYPYANVVVRKVDEYAFFPADNNLDFDYQEPDGQSRIKFRKSSRYELTSSIPHTDWTLDLTPLSSMPLQQASPFSLEATVSGDQQPDWNPDEAAHDQLGFTVHDRIDIREIFTSARVPVNLPYHYH